MDRFSGLLARFLGVFLAIGGIGELIGAVGHGRVNEMLGVLHEDLIVRAWVGVQAIVSIVLGARLLASARGVTLRDPHAMRRAGAAVLTFLGLIVASQLLLIWRLYPQLLETPPPEPFPGFWVLSLAVAPVGPAAMGVVLLVRLRQATSKPSNAGIGVTTLSPPNISPTAARAGLPRAVPNPHRRRPGQQATPGSAPSHVRRRKRGR